MKMKRERRRTQTDTDGSLRRYKCCRLFWIATNGRENPDIDVVRRAKGSSASVIQESVGIPEFSWVYHGSRVSELTEVSESTSQRELRGMQKPFFCAKSHISPALRDRNLRRMTWQETGWPEVKASAWKIRGSLNRWHDWDMMWGVPITQHMNTRLLWECPTFPITFLSRI